MWIHNWTKPVLDVHFKEYCYTKDFCVYGSETKDLKIAACKNGESHKCPAILQSIELLVPPKYKIIIVLSEYFFKYCDIAILDSIGQ